MNSSNLPESFHFVDKATIKPSEIMELRQKVGWKVEDETVWKQCMAASLAVVGVRAQDDTLVGIGFLTGSIRHAILCDFTVDPAFQNRGIGSAILYKRIEIANELGVRYMYTELAKANPLRKKYAALGFKDTGAGLFREYTA